LTYRTLAHVEEVNPSMIELILPSAASCVETFQDEDAELFPAEQAAMAGAVEQRRTEFASVRWCARRALAGLGVLAVPLVPGEWGAPTWPHGIVGSMTHCIGYRASVVAHSSEIIALGIDADQNVPLPTGVAEIVAAQEELRALPRSSDTAWDRVLFSAKESVYKAWFPLTRRFLNFDEAEIDIDPDGSFSARILVPATMPSGEALTGFGGRWIVAHGLVATAIAVTNARTA